MPRRARSLTGGYVYHVLNRSNARVKLFKKQADYKAFEQVLEEAAARVPLRILSYCVMPTHWHFVVWPRRGQGAQVSDFFRWLTLTHTQRWHAHHGTAGTGHVYQGRFKSFPVESDDHVYTVLRYVERNALQAKLVERAEQWRWSSLWRRRFGDQDSVQLLSAWPVPRSRQWLRHVNQPLTPRELDAVRQSVRRGSPYGGADWVAQIVQRMGLEHTVRPRGRPPKWKS